MIQMTEDASNRHRRFGAVSFGYLGSVYVLLIGLLYLWGYWSEFGINILEYLDVSDVVRIAALPLAATLGSLALGVFMGSFLFPLFVPHKAMARMFGPPPTDYSMALRITVGFTLILMAVFYYFGGPKFWLGVSGLAIFPIHLWAIRSDFVRTLFGDHVNAALIFTLLAVLPFIAFGTGKINADQLKVGTKYVYAYQGQLDGVAPELLSSPGQLRLIGTASGLMFFLMPDGESVLLSRLDHARGLQLRRYESDTKKSPSPAARPAESASNDL